jgi:uncharacterized membrane protein YcaP (DUF421 family)
MAHYVIWIVRSLISFVVLLGMARLVGQPFKILVGIAVGGLAAVWSLGTGIGFVDGLCTLATWGILSFAVSKLALKSTGIRNVVMGKPTVVIERGKVLQDNLKKAKLSAYDMMSLLREKNVFQLADVEFAMFEPDGKVSVLLKTDRQPLTPLVGNVQVENQSEPTIVVLEGKVNTQALANMGYERPWLWEQVSNQGAKDWTDIFLAQMDSTGSVYVDLYDDVIPQSKVQSKPLLLASLKKHYADLELYVLQTNQSDVKDMYRKLAEQLSEVIFRVEPYLRG